jgi:ComF family protein
VPSSRVRDLLDLLLDLCLPAACPRCGKALERGATRFCEACLGAIRCVTPPLCSICGTPFVAALTDHPCGACARERPAFRAARAAGAYEGALLEAVHRLKFGGDLVQAPALAGLLGPPLASLPAAAENHGGSLLLSPLHAERESRPSYDLVIPAPLHPRRLRERGFNQAHLIAAEALRTGLFSPWTTLAPNALARVRETAPQTGLRRAQRLGNLRGVFRGKPEAVRGRTILLIDDVMTTGATLEACALALLRAGARSVDALVVARVTTTGVREPEKRGENPFDSPERTAGG